MVAHLDRTFVEEYNYFGYIFKCFRRIVNPFTGKAINSDEKTAHDQFLIDSDTWRVTVNDGSTYLPGKWISVSGNIWDEENWNYYGEEIVLKEHKFPE